MEGQGKVCELLLKSVVYQNVIGFTAIISFRNHSLDMLNFLTFPGEYLRNLIDQHIPYLPSLLGVTSAEDSIGFTIMLTMLAWILVCISLWGVVRLVQNLYRRADSLVRSLCYRTGQTAGNIKTRVVCIVRRFFPLRQSSGVKTLPEITFDDFEFTVLQAVGDCGAGFTTSAPELASKFGMRPGQFKKSLRKLHSSKMIDTVIGSTDGFDNYRLTDYGASYMKVWNQRQSG